MVVCRCVCVSKIIDFPTLTHPYRHQKFALALIHSRPHEERWHWTSLILSFTKKFASVLIHSRLGMGTRIQPDTIAIEYPYPDTDPGTEDTDLGIGYPVPLDPVVGSVHPYSRPQKEIRKDDTRPYSLSPS